MSIEEFSPEFWKKQMEICKPNVLTDIVCGLAEGVAKELKRNNQSIVKLVKDILQVVQATEPLSQPVSQIKASWIEMTRNAVEGLSLVAEGFFEHQKAGAPQEAKDFQEAFQVIQNTLVVAGEEKAREQFKVTAKNVLQKKTSCHSFSALGLHAPAINPVLREWAIALNFVAMGFFAPEDS